MKTPRIEVGLLCELCLSDWCQLLLEVPPLKIFPGLNKCLRMGLFTYLVKHFGLRKLRLQRISLDLVDYMFRK